MNTRAAQHEHSKTQARAQQTGFFPTWAGLLGDAWRALRTGGSRLIGLLLLMHIAAVLLASPLITWLFREALRASGLFAVDFGALQLGGGMPLTLAFVSLIAVLALWFASLQLAVIVVAVRRSQLGLPLTAREVRRAVGRIARKLLRPSSLPLALYLFLILPLSGFGFATVFSQGIAIPPFVSGELMKSPSTSVLLAVVLLLIVILNVRFALTLPVFALTDATGGRSFAASWRLTRVGRALPLLAALVTVLIGAGIASGALVTVALVPTAVTDAMAPDASPFVAAFSLGAAQIAGLLLTSVVLTLIVGVLLAHFSRNEDALTERIAIHPQPTGTPARLSPRAAATAVVSFTVVAALTLGVLAIDTMHKLAQHPSTLVLAHRGVDGVENTISGLEGAAAAGVDLLEMDVMQVKGGEFVAMHDANLTRLAGVDRQLKGLTLSEAQALTLRDAAGHEDQLPTFADFVTRADELGLPLLIEIKLGGADTPDHVDRLVAELEAIGSLERHIYHSLDGASVARLKELRPDVTVGYTMAFAGLGVPDTPADFIVVEEWSASQQMQDAAEAAGLGFMVWTVNEERGTKEMLRRNVDGVITDEPRLVLQARQAMQEERGLADTLIDALTRFVVVF